MACDAMRVRLHLRQIRVVGVLIDTLTVLRVRVESTMRRLRCRCCGFECHRVHDVMCQDMCKVRTCAGRGFSGLVLGLVVAGWVKGEVSEEFACLGCDDSDVEVGD